jgi:hypothetical protein
MEYFARLLGLDKIEKKRSEQLAKQEMLDLQVSKYTNQCPATISQYYLSQREIGRQQQKKFIETCLMDKMKVLEEQLDQNDKLYDELEEALRSQSFCHKLGGGYPPLKFD